MKEIWFCTECTLEDKVKRSLTLADALADMRKCTGDEELLLSEYVVYACLQGYLQRFKVKDADEKTILERRTFLAGACNELAERNPSVKAYIVKRYGREMLA